MNFSVQATEFDADRRDPVDRMKRLVSSVGGSLRSTLLNALLRRKEKTSRFILSTGAPI